MQRVRWAGATGLLGLITLMVLLAWFDPRTAPAVTRAKPVTYSSRKPSEAPVAKTDYVWHGAPNDPKYIRLASIQAEGFVELMGIDQHQQIAAPSNVNFAGWYVNSVRPGQAGLSIIDGHVDGLNGPGIFKRLSKLEPDDQFTIERGDGAIFTYRVVRVQTLAATAAAGELFSQDPTITSQVNLVTCGGAFDRASRMYDARTIVTSQLIPNGLPASL